MIFYGRHIVSHIFSPDKDILGLIFGKLAGTPGPISLNRLCYSLDNLCLVDSATWYIDTNVAHLQFFVQPHWLLSINKILGQLSGHNPHLH